MLLLGQLPEKHEKDKKQHKSINIYLICRYIIFYPYLKQTQEEAKQSWTTNYSGAHLQKN